jgi:subtilase family serine protease
MFVRLGKPSLATILLVVTSLIALLSFALPSHAQSPAAQNARPLITQNIDESKLTVLAGNMRPEARAANDRGSVAHNLMLEHLLLQLKRPAEQETALKALIDDLHNPESANYHHWLTAAEFGERFGLAQQDMDAITNWLTLHGFQVNFVYPSRVMIDFSGTAGQVMQAFHTEIHHLEVNGKSHIANMSEPHIPSALAPAIAGVVSLHDFRPHPMMKPRHQYTFPSGLGSDYYGVVPGDLATIYNFNPVFTAGITGQGQTIVLIEDTDLYSAADWSTFRSTFGLSGYSGSLSQTHPAPPSGPNNCGAPGVNADDGEAILDSEYASAAAPSAAIQMAACADTQTTFGGLIAMQNLVSSSTPPAIISVSYGECETMNGAAANAAFNSTYQQAVTEGTSVYVAAGDSGAAACDQNQTAASFGITVSALASTPYNVAVGGTDFSDTYSGTNATYWNTGNTANYASARSYVPETPWNDSCTGSLLAAYEGYTTSGPGSFCNAAGGLLAAITGTATTAAGGGGPSGCATGAPSINDVVSGSCAGYPKPSWQVVPGNPNDSVRDIPDVSLFAANGLWSHFYVFCYSDTANGGAACTGSPSGWTAAGGTSFASPILAGVQALINQKTGARQGNPNPMLYSLAANQFNGSGSTSCNSSLGNGTAGSCVFYDVTLGDMAVECTTTNNCFDSADGYGVLSTSNSALQPAYATTAGWDFATGIGTINVANLVNAWPGSAPQPDFSISASPTSVTIVQGGAAGSTTITVNPVNAFNGSVNLSTSALPSGVTASFSPNPATGSSKLTLTASGAAATGTVILTITGTSGSLTHTTSVSLTVNAAPPVPDFSLSASPNSLTIVQGGVGGNTTITVTPANGFNGSVGLAVTSALPSGVSAGFNPNPTTGNSTLTLAASSVATVGTVTLTVTGTSGSLTHTAIVSLTVNASAPAPDFSLSAAPSTLSVGRGKSVTSAITVNKLNGFSGAVSLSATGLPKGVTATFNPASTSGSSTLTLKASAPANLGTATVTIKGVSGSLNHTTTISLTTTKH